MALSQLIWFETLGNTCILPTEDAINISAQASGMVGVVQSDNVLDAALYLQEQFNQHRRLHGYKSHAFEIWSNLVWQ